MPSYHQVHPSTSVSFPQLFEACPPVPSCTGTLVLVSPLDVALLAITSITLTNLFQMIDTMN